MNAQLDMQFEARKASRSTQKARVLLMFRVAHMRGEWLTNGDFCRAYLPNFRSRFTEIDAELKSEGLHISDAVFVRIGVFKYRLEPLARDGE